MRINPSPDRSRLIAAAMNRIPCDLSIENVRFYNVMTGEIYPAAVDVLDGIVVRVREQGRAAALPAKSIYDGAGRYLVPGCIDIHMHVESTMLTPQNFAKAAVKCGTTSVFVDPHEIANVLGMQGVEFMIANAKGGPIRQFNLAPSCLPSVVGAEGNGAVFEAPEIAALLETEGVYGVAEVMDFYNVIHDSQKMHDIVAEGLKRDKLVQGHAPQLKGDEIAAYALAGPTDNHCMRSAEDVKENLHAGLYTDLQSSSLGFNTIPQMVEALKDMRYTDHITLCNDDVHAADLRLTGHVNRLIKEVLAAGVDPRDAYRWCTYNAARSARIDDLGAIAPGYAADLQLLDEMDGRDPYAVFRDGELVMENGELKKDYPTLSIPESVLGSTVRTAGLTCADDLRLRAPEGAGESVKTLVVDFTEKMPKVEVYYEDLPVRDGYIDITGHEELGYFAVWNRHGSGAHTVCVAKGLHLLRGALATTVSHDCHNLTLAYKTAEDGYAAAKALVDCGGGFASARDGKVTGMLELGVAGLMSTLPCDELVPAIERVQQSIDANFDAEGYMMSLSISCLACMPCVVVTDLGVFDGRTQQFYELFR